MIVWVDSESLLLETFDKLTETSVIGLDTEFIRTNTFFPKLALLQISDGNDAWLIDVLSINDLSVFIRFFESSEKKFILHSCAEDLEVLRHSLGLKLDNIFDTQVAANFLDIGYCIGYGNLVQTLINISLEKSMTRSDWMKRPLSVGQTRYAAQDVIHLPQLYDILTKLLLKSERLYFFEEEMRYLIKLSYQENQKLKYYQKVKGIWKLNSLELDRLFNLCLWRETQAENSDIPRARVIDDKVLFMLSVKNPKSIDDLSNLGLIQGNKIKKYGFAILDAVKKDQAVKLDPPNKPLNNEQRKLFKSIKTEIMSLAESINMSPSFLCNKKEIETIVRKIESSDNEYEKIFRASWRYTLLKDLIERYKLNYQANH